MKGRLITVVSALALAIPAWVAINGPGNYSGGMSPVHPFPMLTVLASFISVDHGWGLAGALLIWPALFLLWNPSLLRGSHAVPRRTYALWLTTALLSVYWFASYLIDWHDLSRRWHDTEDIHKWRTLGVINGALAVLIGLMLLRIRGLQRSSFASNLLLHWGLFAWLAWCAFPAAELP
jgi:hypothetical protein